MHNFRTLDLAVAFYRQVTGLNLPHHLKDQLLRASSSIALNLAEGRGKPTSRDQLRYFHIAMGSLRESQAVLLLTSDLEPSLRALADRLGAALFLLIRNSKRQ
jgi:four helix bundle protein